MESFTRRFSPSVLCAATLVLYYHYTLPAPYFLDSFGYVAWIREWNESGELPSRYRLANTLLYYWPVTWFGEIALKGVSVAATTMLAGAYYFLIRRDFSSSTALAASLLFLSAPATFISSTHLKEDLTSLLFFTLCLLSIQPGSRSKRSVAAGVAFGFALLFKEVMLAAVPFVGVYLHLVGTASGGWRAYLRPSSVLASIGHFGLLSFSALAVVLLVSPTRLTDFTIMASSPYMGQFLGLFSTHQAAGASFLQEALLYMAPWHLFAVAVFLGTLVGRPPVQAAYLAIVPVLFLFLANVTVVRMRHFTPLIFFLAPIFAEGVGAAVGLVFELLHRKLPTAALPGLCSVGVAAVIAFLQLEYVTPTVDYRLRYNPAREYFAPLPAHLPENALLLGMDNCPIASYESGLDCENHPPDLSPQAASRYAEAIVLRTAAQPVYLLPDFFEYDASGSVRRVFGERFGKTPVYTGWYEPYHPMTYGVDVDDLVARRVARMSPCVLRRRDSTPRSLSPQLSLDEVRLVFECPDGQRQLVVATYRGHSTYLSKRDVVSITPR